ncbi:MAG: 3-hydroxyacyl-CoA dehydrogenase family protein [Thermaerobacter sp.]|nr:3-hydroxyacyl-CoA dehydrogenase family protein [Thermaerobacter sp.]
MYVFKAAVLGAGTMGAEIAQVISLSGLPVVLKDVDPAQLERGMEHIRDIYARRVQRGRISEHDAQDRIALVTPQLDYQGFSDVDLVIEAVPEKLELKQAVLGEVEGHVAKTALLATNTSALPVTEVGAKLHKPQRLVGMHFFFPASVMKLVEVIAGAQTEDEAVDSAVEFVEGIRRIGVRVRECPGFLVNRILMAGLAEVFRAEQDLGLGPKEIDAAVAASRLAPMGPYALADALGLDIAQDVSETLKAAYGERFDLGTRITALIAEGKRGAKTGAGFYTYTG